MKRTSSSYASSTEAACSRTRAYLAWSLCALVACAVEPRGPATDETAAGTAAHPDSSLDGDSPEGGVTEAPAGAAPRVASGDGTAGAQAGDDLHDAGNPRADGGDPWAPDGGAASDAGRPAAVCASGALRCSEDRAALEVCTNDGSAWVRDEVCGEGVCEPTTLRCLNCMGPPSCLNERVRTECVEGGDAVRRSHCVDLDPARPYCAGAGECMACRPGLDQRCADGKTVEVCDADGAWGSTLPCDAGRSCWGGTCGGACEPGARRCAPGEPHVQSCTPAQEWQTVERCEVDYGAFEVCREGACVAQPQVTAGHADAAAWSDTLLLQPGGWNLARFRVPRRTRVMSVHAHLVPEADEPVRFMAIWEQEGPVGAPRPGALAVRTDGSLPTVEHGQMLSASRQIVLEPGRTYWLGLFLTHSQDPTPIAVRGEGMVPAYYADPPVDNPVLPRPDPFPLEASFPKPPFRPLGMYIRGYELE